MTNRPYLASSIEQLENLVRSSEGDRATLESVFEELAHRKSSRANVLMQKTAFLLEGVIAPSPNEGAEQLSEAVAVSTGAPPDPGDGTVQAPEASTPTSKVTDVAQTKSKTSGQTGPRRRKANRTEEPPPEDVPLLDLVEKMRRRLLDLSAKNPLLSFRHSPTSCVRLIDEVPSQVFEQITSGKTMEFAPISQTDDKEADEGADEEHDNGERGVRLRRQAQLEAKLKALAEAEGIDPSFELPDVAETRERRHRDSLLQTLALPGDLESLLRKIHQKTRNELQEKGANVLHLLFGFVEWSDVPSDQRKSDDWRIAPLVLVPVAIERGRLDTITRPRTYRYTVRATGEDWDTNVTLNEKCEQDLGISLPEIDEDADLESYFRKVEKWIETNTDEWRFCRYVTLGRVSFGKILMWKDLDPKTWPGSKPLLENPLFREVLGEGVEEGAAPEVLVDEYRIDEISPSTDIPPVVLDADSSQHSVLIEVARGKNLVVQGPPGTGKSQTIANIIAAEVFRGRKVLFVAEKKAALDVVHRRLSQLGLGPFCLALHSHSSEKKGFLDDLATRIRLRNRVPRPRDIDGVEEELRSQKKKLNNYVQHLNAHHEVLEMSGFEVLWRAKNLLDSLPPNVARAVGSVTIPAATKMSRGQLAEAKSVIRDFGASVSDVLSDAGVLGAHPWYGVRNPNLSQVEIQKLLDGVRTLLATLGPLEAAFRDLDGAAASSFRHALSTVARLKAQAGPLVIPEEVARSQMPARVLQSNRVPELARALQAVQAARASWQKLDGRWRSPGALSREDGKRFESAILAAMDRLGEDLTFEAATQAVAVGRNVLELLDRVERVGSALVSTLSLDVGLTPRIAERLSKIVQAARGVSDLAFDLRSEATKAELADRQLNGLSQEAKSLSERRSAFAKSWPTQLRPTLEELRRHAAALANAPGFLPSVFSKDYRAARAAFRTGTSRKEKRDVMLAEVRSLLQYEDELARFTERPELAQYFGGNNRGIDSPFEAALECVRWRREVAEHSQGLGSASMGFHQAAWNVSRDKWREAAALSVQDESFVEVCGDLLKAVPAFARAVKSSESAWLEFPLVRLRNDVHANLTLLGNLVEPFKSATVEPGCTAGMLLDRLKKVQAAWRKDDAAGPLLADLVAVSADPSSDSACAELGAALGYVAALKASGLPDATVGVLCSGEQEAALAVLKEAVGRCEDASGPVRSAAADVEATGGIEWTDWLAQQGGRFDDVEVAALEERLRVALSGEEQLYTWAQYLGYRSKAEAVAGQELCKLVDARKLDAARAADGFEAAAFVSVAQATVNGTQSLMRFSGSVHEKLRGQFAERDEALIKLTARLVAHELSKAEEIAGVSYGLVKNQTEESLIKQQASLQRPRVPIRDLFRRAGRAIVNLKPCVMMSPQAISQYLAPGHIEFDIVVMDEASQIRPEDALGAIARGRQVVVVGDPHQLGPTSFFDRHADDDDDEEDEGEEQGGEDGGAVKAGTANAGATVLERSESILTAVQARFPLRMLRWHYRSRNPRLIAFSNKEFYRDLIVFPTPQFEGARDGVFFHRVQGAVYEGRRNLAEAQAVVEALRRHAAEHPDKSVMVATMNFPQADLIDELIQKAEKTDEVLAAFRARHEGGPEPLDVKNLENVQGDERDVILVSITYGPRENGTFSRGFGPINQLGGERRLNVLITRAKHRVDVFCSFDPEMLRVEPTSPRGLRVLHDYLRYAQGGTWATGRADGKEPDSDFEVAVARALQGQGFEVHFQVGVAGYWIDLAVVHPKQPGRYVIGVECDGARYHSAKSARDRDRLRQRVLEGYGWTIHRIWSTDWFRTPEVQVAKLVDRINRLVTDAKT